MNSRAKEIRPEGCEFFLPTILKSIDAGLQWWRLNEEALAGLFR
jgi:hypothetical protein